MQILDFVWPWSRIRRAEGALCAMLDRMNADARERAAERERLAALQPLLPFAENDQ